MSKYDNMAILQSDLTVPARLANALNNVSAFFEAESKGDRRRVTNWTSYDAAEPLFLSDLEIFGGRGMSGSITVIWYVTNAMEAQGIHQPKIVRYTVGDGKVVETPMKLVEQDAANPSELDYEHMMEEIDSALFNAMDFRTHVPMSRQYWKEHIQKIIKRYERGE